MTTHNMQVPKLNVDNIVCHFLLANLLHRNWLTQSAAQPVLLQEGCSISIQLSTVSIQMHDDATVNTLVLPWSEV
jgi:hypothetical protein